MFPVSSLYLLRLYFRQVAHNPLNTHPNHAPLLFLLNYSYFDVLCFRKILVTPSPLFRKNMKTMDPSLLLAAYVIFERPFENTLEI